MNSSAINSASAGIQQNIAVLNAAASSLASSPVDHSSVGKIIDMKIAKEAVSANVAVLKTANEMSEQIVDLLV